MKNTTKTIYLTGVSLIIFSVIRWGGVIYDDLSQMGLGVLIGIVICGFAYVHGWMVMKDLKDENLEQKHDSLVSYLHSKEIIKNKDFME